MVEQAKRQIWRNGGRFYGYRINSEQVPMLGACTVRASWRVLFHGPVFLKSSR